MSCSGEDPKSRLHRVKPDCLAAGVYFGGIDFELRCFNNGIRFAAYENTPTLLWQTAHGGSEGIAVCCAKARRTHGATEAHGGSTTAQKMRRPAGGCGISHLFQKAVSCASGDSRTFIAKPCLYRRTAPFSQNRIFPASRTFPQSRTFFANRAFSANHTFPRAAPFREKESSSLIAGMPFFLPPSLTPGGGGDIINYSSGANRLFGGML